MENMEAKNLPNDRTLTTMTVKELLLFFINKFLFLFNTYIFIFSAIITTPSGQKQVPRIIDNKDGTIKIGYQPTEVGPHVLQTFYSGVPIPNGTYNFYVHSTKPGQVSAFGPGLIGGISGQSTSFTVVTKDAGPGQIGL